MPEPTAVVALDCPALKRLAVQISLQLPADHAEALAVLGYMRDIADWEAGLVRPARVHPEETGAVLAFSRPA